MDKIIAWFKEGGWKTVVIVIAAFAALVFAFKFWYVIVPVAAVLYAIRHWDTVKGWFVNPNAPPTAPPGT